MGKSKDKKEEEKQSPKKEEVASPSKASKDSELVVKIPIKKSKVRKCIMSLLTCKKPESVAETKLSESEKKSVKATITYLSIDCYF